MACKSDLPTQGISPDTAQVTASVSLCLGHYYSFASDSLLTAAPQFLDDSVRQTAATTICTGFFQERGFELRASALLVKHSTT
jgi:hypothetical protein